MNRLKKIISIIFLFGLLFSLSAQSKAITNNKATFTKGVNLCEWFEIWSPGIPPLRRYDKEDFEYLKAMGCDVIRLPIHFDMVMTDEKPWKVNPVVFEYLDKACDWAEELGMFLVIDNHSFNGLKKYPTPAEVEKFLEELWPQIVNHYKNRSEYILYEILNEPEMKNPQWLPIQKKILDLIRSMDEKHTVVVTGAEWGGLNTMLTLKPYDDRNLIYSFHFYDPFVFTHQGASWCSDEQAALENIPFPYDRKRIPKLKGAAKGSYLEQTVNQTYAQQGTESYLRKTLQKAIDFSEKNKVPVWCGEMGAYNLKSQVEDRARWFETVGGILLEKQIPFTVWGFHGGFGLFKKDTQGLYPKDLEVEVVKSVGLSIPKGLASTGITEFPKNFVLYDDLSGKNLSLNAWGLKSMKADNINAVQGINCLKCTDINQYGAVSFGLENIDFSLIEKVFDDAVLTFYVKFTSAAQKFQVRFVDSETKELKPWRTAVNFSAKTSEVNKWVKIEKPLSDFNITGAWSSEKSKWYVPDSDDNFDWSRVRKFEIVAEDGNISGDFYLDDIRIEIRN